MDKCAAIVLAAGRGKRMNSEVPKQYLLLNGKPILYYSLKALEESFVDEIVLVAAESDRKYCHKEIVEKYDLKKVSAIVSGGAERYHSVWNGITSISDCDYLFIQDGARPFLTKQIIEAAYQCVKECDACVAAVPVKDTIKEADKHGVVTKTLKRDVLYQIQTPQVFRFELIKNAYEKLILQEREITEKGVVVTDDAMVLELMLSHPVKISEGDYTNIKITTPEDLLIAESIIKLHEL